MINLDPSMMFIVVLALTIFSGLFICVVHLSKVNVPPFIKFVFVGGFNTLNYYTCYLIMLNVAPFMVSHLTAFTYSAIVSYFLTSIFTFNLKPNLKSFLAFPITILPNMFLSSFGSYALVYYQILDEKYASICMMIIIIPVTYIISKIVFKHTNNKDLINDKKIK